MKVLLTSHIRLYLWGMLVRCLPLEYSGFTLHCREYTVPCLIQEDQKWTTFISPGKFWWCHCGWCQPGKGQTAWAAFIFSGGHWIHTHLLGKAGANSQLPLAIRKAEDKGEGERSEGTECLLNTQLLSFFDGHSYLDLHSHECCRESTHEICTVDGLWDSLHGLSKNSNKGKQNQFS